jgi:hypothetical protein
MITKDSRNGDVMCWFSWDATIFCNIPNEEQTYATHPLFLFNLHFEHFVTGVNISTMLNYLTKSSKWRLCKKKGMSGIRLTRRDFE